MKQKKLMLFTLIGTLLLSSAGFVLAFDQGDQLMTLEERRQYSDQMRAAKNADEQAQIRSEYHQRMKERANERGDAHPNVLPPSGGMSPDAGGMNSPGVDNGIGGDRSY